VAYTRPGVRRAAWDSARDIMEAMRGRVSWFFLAHLLDLKGKKRWS
jgi:hypothetical protein